jgi:hypothetical protein
LKWNGKDPKEISLVDQGFQAFIDRFFWFLQFSNLEQAYELLAKLERSRTLDHHARLS